MARPSTDISPDDLLEYAKEYVKECISSTKEMPTARGAVKVKERHIPTVEYFLRIWLPLLAGVTINKSTYYAWLKSDNQVKSDAIKEIQELFNSLAADIVANEGKGIFFAKNKLGWTDKVKSENVNHSAEISSDEAREIAKAIMNDIT